MSSALLAYFGLAALMSPPLPIEHRSVSLEMANSIAEAALVSCRTLNRDAVVTIVDRGGNLIALQCGDEVGPHNTNAAERKAFTALSTKTSTSRLAQRAATEPASANLASVAELLLLGGGLPIIHDGEVIGGIGVAGSGGSENDEQCAMAALTHGTRQ